MHKRLDPKTFIKQGLQEAVAMPATTPPAHVAPAPKKAMFQEDGSIVSTAKSAEDALWFAVDAIAHKKCSSTYSREGVIGTVNLLKTKKGLVKEHNGQFTVTLTSNQVDAIANIMVTVYNQAMFGK